MALGAYSVIRYSNDLNDQRVNLGVLLWHPLDGVRHRVSPFLHRAQAVDPRVRMGPLKEQINAILGSFTSEAASEGRDGLKRLSSVFRNGVQVSSPYPAEMFDVDAMMERLYSQLVSPIEEIRRAGTQRQYEKSLKAGLSSALKRLGAGFTVHDHGLKQLNGIAVNVGIRTSGPQLKAFWRGVSLQAEDRPDDQIAKAKATALDIATIRTEMPDFKRDRQFVAVQPPKTKAAERLKESIAWLDHYADNVFVVQAGEAMATSLEGALANVLSQPRMARR